jgi:hypothetical protein
MGILGNDENVRVQILYSEGCANSSPTLELVKNIANDLKIAVNIEMVMVGTQEQAQQFRFLGSPTVQIDGLDIEPSAIYSLAFGLT